MFTISSQRVTGFWFCEWSNFAISHRKAWSPLTRCLIKDQTLPTWLPRGHLPLCQISLQYLYGELPLKYVKYYAFVTFLWSCHVLSWLYFFSLATPPRSNPWTEFNHLWLKWRVVTQGCAFWGFEWPPTILRGSKPPKRGVVSHFPAKVAKL